MDASPPVPNVVDFAAFRQRKLAAQRRANPARYLLWYPGIGCIVQGASVSKLSPGQPAGGSLHRG